MAWWAWLLVVVGAAYFALLVALWLTGRRAKVVALARLVPDSVGLVRGLIGDPRVPRRWRWALAGLLAYLMLPFDLVPDFLPVVGQVDDAVLVVVVLRGVLRAAGPSVVAEHWAGSQSVLAILTRVAAPRSRRAGGEGGRRRPSG
ncbi:MAG: hypothetical protein V7607_6775 [Solirubrobacteraceae bacterium]